jgi:hypothetical protein
MPGHRHNQKGKNAPQTNESPPKPWDDDLRNSALQRHVDYVDLAERVVQGITVWQDFDFEEANSSPSSRLPARKRPRR